MTFVQRVMFHCRWRGERMEENWDRNHALLSIPLHVSNIFWNDFDFEADVERERQSYIAWQGRVEDWRQLKCREAIEKFK